MSKALPYTDEEHALIRQMAHAKVKTADVAAMLGRTLYAIEKRRQVIGAAATGPRRWTAEEVALVNKLIPSMTYREIGAHVGRSPKAIEVMAGRRTSRPNKRSADWTEEEDAMLRRLFPDHTTNQAAERLGRSAKSVERRAARLGLQKSPAYLVGIGRDYQLLAPELREVITLTKKIRKELKNAAH